MKKQFIQLLFAVGVVSTLGACKDFQEINKDPNAVDETSVKIDYLLNSSIYKSQMDPGIAERMFVLYWDRVSGYERNVSSFERNDGLSMFSYNDGWSSDYYAMGEASGWLTDVTLAITIGSKRIADPAFPQSDKPRLKNIVQMARIWRAYLVTEMSDNFGPMLLSQYDGTVITEMSSVEDVYTFVLKELKEAVETIDLKVALNNDEKKNDLFYAGDLKLWQRYANSMRMRFAMRVGKQAEFEEAVAHPAGYIEEVSHIAGVMEKGGWDPTTAVMSRTWNQQQLSLTFANLTVGLGGVDVSAVRNIQHSGLNGISDADYAQYVKDPQSYLGMKMENYISPSTNVTNAQYLMDYIPNNSDPRLYLLFAVPGVNNEYSNYYPQQVAEGQNIQKIYMADQGTAVPKTIKKEEKAVQDTILLRAKCNMTAMPFGSAGEYNSNFVAFTGEYRNWATKSEKWRNRNSDNGNKRIFFGPWESYFLIAEAGLKGWATPLSDQAAYEKGVEVSFSWHGISGQTGAYLASQDYSRVGTSVAYAHTSEAVDHNVDYIDFQSNLEVAKTEKGVKTYQLKANPTVSQVMYKYPKGRYATNNDKLTKIITQKYLANSPYLPNEAWNDYRRLNLPFMENPVAETAIAEMPWYSKADCGKFIWENVPQRIPFPSGMQSTNPAAYASGLTKLGGADAVSTKLPWAIAK